MDKTKIIETASEEIKHSWRAIVLNLESAGLLQFLEKDVATVANTLKTCLDVYKDVRTNGMDEIRYLHVYSPLANGHNTGTMVLYEQALYVVETELSMLKLIMEKSVDIKLVKMLNNADAYNNFGNTKRIPLTEEKFSLIKEGGKKYEQNN